MSHESIALAPRPRPAPAHAPAHQQGGGVMNTTNDLIRRLMEQLENYDDANPYHDCADLILEARLFLEREEDRARIGLRQ